MSNKMGENTRVKDEVLTSRLSKKIAWDLLCLCVCVWERETNLLLEWDLMFYFFDFSLLHFTCLLFSPFLSFSPNLILHSPPLDGFFVVAGADPDCWWWWVPFG